MNFIKIQFLKLLWEGWEYKICNAIIFFHVQRNFFFLFDVWQIFIKQIKYKWKKDKYLFFSKNI